MFEIKSEPDMDKVETLAEDILSKYGLMQAPVNPIAVAKRLGYSVNASVFFDSSTSGRVCVRDGKVRIDVNASEHSNRLRYTIAHEIGHALLDLNDIESGELIDSKEMFRAVRDHVRPFKEARADRFAAALLMPEKLVRDRFKYDKDEQSLAHYFGVSHMAMHIRLEQLRLVAR